MELNDVSCINEGSYFISRVIIKLWIAAVVHCSAINKMSLQANQRIQDEAQETLRIQWKAFREIIKACLKINYLIISEGHLLSSYFVNVILTEGTWKHIPLVADDMWTCERTAQFAVRPTR